MANKRVGHHPNPDLRHRVPGPLPPVAAIEAELRALVTPALLAPRVLERRDPHNPERVIRMRARILTLPVMVALVVSLVWRRLGSIAEVARVIAQDGLLWVAPLQVSEQALTKRLDTLPASALAAVFTEVGARLQAQPPPALPGLERWATVRARFPRIAIVDGSTLEAVRKKTQTLQGQEGVVLAGRMMVMVEAFTHRPLWQLYIEDAAANDKRFGAEILAALPAGGLLVFDLGFFSFLWFDDFTQQQKYFVTRLRQKTAYRPTQVLSQGPYSRDELITVGLYRSNPCRHPLRLVSVLWQGQWYRYLTNVLDPHLLSARQVCEVYRRRWRIEDAFLVTKRVLDLAYLWKASANGIQLQLYATLLFYTVLLNVCQQVAQSLGEPLERISVEMVFRAFYHYSRALERGEGVDLVPYLGQHADLLGLVKRWRKRHHERQQMEQLVWGGS
ncbi:MAG TPA: IS4 family transposase [Anaerolineales bacterium]